MHPQIELNLALILFLPWFAILGVLFWVYPRTPRTGARRLFDLASLLLATGAAVAGMWWGMSNADAQSDPIWRQILASLMVYGLFLLVLGTAFWLRWRLFSGSNRCDRIE